MQSGRLAVGITTASGTTYRWGGDEPDAQDQPTSLSFSTAMPGGFKDCSMVLPRRIDLEYPDLNLLDDVRVYGPGNETVWEGRVHALPRSHGSDTSITVQCVGWSAHLKDDPSFRGIYVDRDLSAWETSAVQRQINLIGLSFGLQSHAVQGDDTTGAPSLATSVRGAWSSAAKGFSEAWYDAGPGMSIASLEYAWKKSTNVSEADANWIWQTVLSTDDLHTTVDTSGNLRAAGPGTGTLTAAGTRRFATAQTYYNVGPAGSDNVTYGLWWTYLAVFGNHGLTKRTTVAGQPSGFYASDVIEHIISEAAPELSWHPDNEETAFAIPHLAFKEPTTAEEAILRANAFNLWEWAVYNDRKFIYRAPDVDRLVWEARLDQGAHLDLEGDQSDDLVNGVIVHYDHPNEGRRTAGPPGSGFDVTDATLEDTSDANPVNAHGIAKKWGELTLSSPTTDAGAVQLGAIWLAEHAIPQRSGTVQLQGTVRHPTMGERPAWAVRAGDSVRIADHPSDAPRRIVETRYDHSSRQASLSVGAGAAKLDAILERLGVQVQFL